MRQTAWLAMLAISALAVAAGGATSLSAAITDDLVVHLRFDGNTDDSSPRNNDGAPGGTGLFYIPASTNSDGVARTPFLGSGALDLTYAEPTEFVTFSSALADLQFGANTDFTVSIWAQRVINPNASDISDPSIIGNKDWDAGGNKGWVLFDRDEAWGWNWKGADGSRRDFDGRPLPAGEWHNIAVTQDRDGLASFYHDGTLLGTRNIAGSGDIDTDDLAQTTNVGQDGTGVYTPKLTHNLDDLGIWRRALTGAEILTIVKQGRSGVAISEISPDDVLVAGDVNGDGVTNNADYVVWNANVGFDNGTGSGTDDSYAKGDADFNGKIDLGDFRIIADAAHPPLGVPEPGAWALAVCGLLSLGLLRRKS